jgi:chromosome segregation ATPase
VRCDQVLIIALLILADADLESENDSLRKSGNDSNTQTTYLNEKLDVMKQMLQAETDEKTELASKKETLEHQVSKLKKEKAELEAEREHLQKEREALEHEQKGMMESMERFNKAKQNMEAQYQQRADMEAKGLDLLRKNLVEHLGDMHTWKKYLEQDREYKADSIQNVTEKAIASASFEDQCTQLSQALASENTRLQQLLKEREVEAAERAAAVAATTTSSKKK